MESFGVDLGQVAEGSGNALESLQWNFQIRLPRKVAGWVRSDTSFRQKDVKTNQHLPRLSTTRPFVQRRPQLRTAREAVRMRALIAKIPAHRYSVKLHHRPLRPLFVQAIVQHLSHWGSVSSNVSTARTRITTTTTTTMIIMIMVMTIVQVDSHIMAMVALEMLLVLDPVFAFILVGNVRDMLGGLGPHCHQRLTAAWWKAGK